jgi:hypothetical protein
LKEFTIFFKSPGTRKTRLPFRKGATKALVVFYAANATSCDEEENGG